MSVILNPMECPCRYWARTAELLHESGHHPKCNSKGQWKYFPVKGDEPKGDRVWLRMVCDKCGAAVSTNELSYRKRKCSCIGCGGNLRYFNSADVQFPSRLQDDPEWQSSNSDNSLSDLGGKIQHAVDVHIKMVTANAISGMIVHGCEMCDALNAVYDAFMEIQNR